MFIRRRFFVYCLIAAALLLNCAWGQTATTDSGTSNVGGSSPPSAGVERMSREDVLKHVISSGDTLEIHLLSLPTLEKQYIVRADGYFFHPVGGEILAAGRTLGELSEELDLVFKEELRNPHFRLGISNFAQVAITVFGEVERPGNVMVGVGSTILDVIANVGGVTDVGDPEEVTIIRDREQFDVSLDHSEEPFVVQSGDIIIAKQGQQVTINGEVANPGVYAIGKKVHPFDLIIKAGGVKKNAALSRVRLIRNGLDKPISLDLRPGSPLVKDEKSLYLEAGDSVVVPISQVVVMGDTGAKAVPLEGGETLLDVIAAGATGKESDLGRVSIIRAKYVLNEQLTEQDAEKVEPETYDVERMLNSDLREIDMPLVHDGDVVFIPNKRKGLFGKRDIFSIFFLARGLFATFF